MKKLLTITIPTYNRAPLLQNQLEWVARAVKGRESQCELIITDNCSTDETPEVIGRWKAALEKTGLEVRANRNVRNIGAIRNIAFGVREAKGEFVWAVSDDDAVADDSLAFVMNAVQEHPDLFLLILNFSSRHWRSGKLKFARCFEIEETQIEGNGKRIVEENLKHPNSSRWGGLLLTTALVYRTDAAQAALKDWPEGLDNLTWQLYITAYCALLGKTVLTKDAHLEMAGGRHFFTKDRQMFLRFKLAETPEAFIKLAQMGYARGICEQKIIEHRHELKPRLLFQNLVRGPLATVRVLQRYRRAMDCIKEVQVTALVKADLADAK